MKYYFGVFFSAVLILAACAKESGVAPDPVGTTDCATITYSGLIANLMEVNCGTSKCHGPGSRDGVMTNYNGLNKYVKNGTFKKEVLDRRTMPENDVMTEEELWQIKCWLDAGAPNN